MIYPVVDDPPWVADALSARKRPGAARLSTEPETTQAVREDLEEAAAAMGLACRQTMDMEAMKVLTDAYAAYRSPPPPPVGVPAPSTEHDFSNPYLVNVRKQPLCVKCGWTAEFGKCSPEPAWRERYERALSLRVESLRQPKRIYPDFSAASPLAAALESPALGMMNRPRR